eukprot:GEZU01003792.1.p1 GENE.GEZU01003792.1~~GEZU01003792.1.p1  ORF type:complete len:223 (-),score=33.97 GEZU01003792.1:80-748(-)
MNFSLANTAEPLATIKFNRAAGNLTRNTGRFPFPLMLDTVALADSLNNHHHHPDNNNNNKSNWPMCHQSEFYCEIPAAQDATAVAESAPLMPSSYYYVPFSEKESTEVANSSTTLVSTQPLPPEPALLQEGTVVLEAANNKHKLPPSHKTLASSHRQAAKKKKMWSSGSSSALEEAIRRPSLKWNPQGTGLISNGSIKRKTGAKPYDKRTLVWTIVANATNQ